MDDVIEFVFEVIIEFIGGFVLEIKDSVKAKRAQKRKNRDKSNAQSADNSVQHND